MNLDALKKAEETQLKNIESTSGIKLDQWTTIIKNCGFSKHGEIVNFLKKEHGLGHGNANMLVHYANKSHSGFGKEDELLTQQFEGKEEWKGLYDQLITEIKKFGDDIEISPKKAYVSVRRQKQFAILQPSTKNRFDIGLNIKDFPPNVVLEPAGSWNTMCTHRIKITKQEDLTDQVIQWVREAYNQA
ncbi:MAG: DUF4287 domain-containing protein [Chitinophagaceae bacterium]|nr:MAG: DUF4287 domain-containing protein [Chitinophagaceae bacterium]